MRSFNGCSRSSLLGRPPRRANQRLTVFLYSRVFQLDSSSAKAFVARSRLRHRFEASEGCQTFRTKSINVELYAGPWRSVPERSRRTSADRTSRFELHSANLSSSLFGSSRDSGSENRNSLLTLRKRWSASSVASNQASTSLTATRNKKSWCFLPLSHSSSKSGGQGRRSKSVSNKTGQAFAILLNAIEFFLRYPNPPRLKRWPMAYSTGLLERMRRSIHSLKSSSMARCMGIGDFNRIKKVGTPIVETSSAERRQPDSFPFRAKA